MLPANYGGKIAKQQVACLTALYGMPIVWHTTGEPGLASSGEREVGEEYLRYPNPALPPQR